MLKITVPAPDSARAPLPETIPSRVKEVDEAAEIDPLPDKSTDREELKEALDSKIPLLEKVIEPAALPKLASVETINVFPLIVVPPM